ncbi:MAG TPA: amidohydrolase family protein [Verrucomicrobiae bacterium]|nr:amidohydrolase family protein [Verrucomicrobiae bacterium]
MNKEPSAISRRHFLVSWTCAAAGAVVDGSGAPAFAQAGEIPIIDIHQHTNYAGRTNEQLVRHQQVMGVTTTVLLPAGRFYGLDAKCGGNDTVVELKKQHPDQFVCFANEVADIDEAPEVIRHFLRRGAVGIGEQKFRVGADSRFLERIARLAEEFSVPLLMHFQHGVYNTDIQNFHRTLEKFPRVNFIGHAQTWWGNVDAKHDQKVLYPTGPVTPGGITDRLLSDYPNIYGDHSAGSGLNFLVRDPEFAALFIRRHQNKLLFGSDCDDILGTGPGCTGAQILSNLRKLARDEAVQRKILFENARKLLGSKVQL